MPTAAPDYFLANERRDNAIALKERGEHEKRSVDAVCSRRTRLEQAIREATCFAVGLVRVDENGTSRPRISIATKRITADREAR